MESDNKSEFTKTLRKFEVSGDKSPKVQKKGHLIAKSQSIDNLNSISLLSPFEDYTSKSKL